MLLFESTQQNVYGMCSTLFMRVNQGKLKTILIRNYPNALMFSQIMSVNVVNDIRYNWA